MLSEPVAGDLCEAIAVFNSPAEIGIKRQWLERELESKRGIWLNVSAADGITATLIQSSLNQLS